MRVRLLLICGALCAACTAMNPSAAAAQGCVLLRQTSPCFGTTGSPNQDVGTWNITFTARNSTADIHYNGTERQRQRETEKTYVVNRQNAITATIGYQLTRRVSLNAGIPFVEAAWGIPSPRTGGNAARANENARGLGDVTTLARVSLMDPAVGRSWNVEVGGGIKLPTGNNAATDVFPDRDGLNNVERYVDVSVHPGDGGWGAIFDLQGYKAIGRVLAFGSGTWLANPRNTGTASRGNIVGDPNPSNINSVSDQFVFRAGTSVSINSKISANLSWRMEGVPRYDLFGRSDGFRRPGVEMYWEPGITIMSGRHAVSMNVPIGYYYNRFRNPYTGNAGDATFPEYVAIATYSVRLGGLRAADHGLPGVPALPEPAPAPTPTPGVPNRPDSDGTGQ